MLNEDSEEHPSEPIAITKEEEIIKNLKNNESPGSKQDNSGTLEIWRKKLMNRYYTT